MILKIFLFLLSINISDNIRILNKDYEISFTIVGKGYQVILGEKAQIPDILIINGERQSVANILIDVQEQINNITVIWNSMPSCSQMFDNMNSIISIDLSNFDSSQIIDISGMFKDCSKLNYINFSNFDVSFVENLDELFYNCISLTSLDLSNLYTISAVSMEGMFQNAESLISLDLKNFDTSSVTNMKNMFNNCKSLKHINLISFVEKENLLIENIFSSEISNITFCIDHNKAPNIFSILKSNNFENCENNNENHFISENIDKNSTTDNIESSISEVIDEDSITDNYDSSKNINNMESNTDITQNVKDSSKNGQNEIIYEKPSNLEEINDNIINNLKIFTLNNLDSFASNIINGTKEDIIFEFNNITYQMTTTENQKNSNYSNLSTINLGECEEKLKDVYGISENLSLIILKIDYNVPFLLIPLIGYEIYHPINKSRLDLKYCNDSLIKINIPVTINENKIFIYDPNSDYYNDECYTYTTENGTDIILNDRKSEFNDKNLSLCEKNCTFKGYDSNTKKALCECEIKIDINTIQDILNEENILSNNFKSNQNNELDIGTLKCISFLFSKKGLLNNIGSYILMFTIVLFVFSIIIFCKCGYQIIISDIDEIIDSKIKKSDNVDIYDLENNKIHKKKKKKKKIDLSNPLKKNKRNNRLNLEKEKPNHIHIISKSELKNTNTNIMLRNDKINNDNGNIAVYNDNKIKISEINDNIINIKEFEMNSFTYKEALESDKRTYCKYYFYLIKIKISFLFAFYPIDDYNIKIIKICLFFLFFCIYFAVNKLFFNESAIHQIYKDGGKYNFAYFLPQILYSFIISYISTTAIKHFSLSERKILEIKREVPNKLKEKIGRIKICLLIKYIIFFIISSIFLIIFWFYLSSFCAVYKNTQIYLIINTCISIGISFIYIIIFNLLPSSFRIISLKNESSRNNIFFKISKIFQLL